MKQRQVFIPWSTGVILFSRLERLQKQHNLRAQKQQKQSSFTSCRLQDALDYRLALHRVPSTLCEFLLDRSVSLYPFSSFTSSGADCSSFFPNSQIPQTATLLCRHKMVLDLSFFRRLCFCNNLKHLVALIFLGLQVDFLHR